MCKWRSSSVCWIHLERVREEQTSRQAAIYNVSESQENAVGLQPDTHRANSSTPGQQPNPLSILCRFLCKGVSASSAGLVVSGARCTSDAFYYSGSSSGMFFMQMKLPLSLRYRKSKGCQDDSVSPSSGWYPQRRCSARELNTIYNTARQRVFSPASRAGEEEEGIKVNLFL